MVPLPEEFLILRLAVANERSGNNVGHSNHGHRLYRARKKEGEEEKSIGGEEGRRGRRRIYINRGRERKRERRELHGLQR